MIAGRGKKIHEDGLDGLGLVNNSFCADLKASNRLGVNVVFAHQTGDNWGKEIDETKGICVKYASYR
jgi:hypothetical protein